VAGHAFRQIGPGFSPDWRSLRSVPAIAPGWDAFILLLLAPHAMLGGVRRANPRFGSNGAPTLGKRTPVGNIAVETLHPAHLGI
jgi:hypothetical protein